MNILTMEHLTKSYTERLLFDDADFSMQDGEKIGLIGINGTGKSTLLRLAAGLEEPDDGTIVTSRGLHIRFLPQNPVFEPGHTVLQSVLAMCGDEGQIWDLESQAKSMLNKLEINEFDQEVGRLSGGQRKRVALAGVLLSRAELLILDEPTNHLDSEMARWLEDYLKKYKGALLMVTHDRYFLDSVTNRIVELDKGKLYSYQASYSGYLTLKAERESIELAGERKRQSILRTELAWIQRGARARSTKQKARIERFEEMSAAKGPVQDQNVEMESVASRLGRTTVEIEHLSKAFGDKVLFQDFSYIFLKGDRLGIVGKNGCGKTTLMKILAGVEQPDSGTIQIGQTVKIGYFSQENEYMDGSMKVIDYIRDVAEYIKTNDGSISASMMLERFLFPSSMQYTTIDRLSGGEKRRLYLLRILMGAPNVLLMDEPTNDLDIQTLTVLEDYLDSFPGIVAVVSHDRYFLDRVARRIFAFEEDKRVVQYEGGYTDYQIASALKEQDEEKAAKPAQAEVKKTPADSRVRPKKLKFTYQEQKDWETIEDDIARMEERISDLDKQIEQAASDYGRLRGLMEEKQQAEAALEEKMDRWMYLTDLAEQISNQ